MSTGADALPDPADAAAPELRAPGRRRRRAVGPPEARPSGAVPADLLGPLPEEPVAEDDERLLREVPPHHG